MKETLSCFLKKILSVALVLSLLVCICPLSSSANNTTSMPAAHLWTNFQGGAYISLSLQMGKTYTFTAYYMAKGSSAGIYVDGSRILTGKRGLNGADYNLLTGKISYSFVAQKSNTEISFSTYDENGNVATDSGMDCSDVHIWFASPALTESEGANIDISVDKWSYFYSNCNHEITETSADFFGEELVTGHLWTSFQGTASVKAEVNTDKRYTFSMYLKTLGSSAGIAVDGVYILSGNAAKNGAQYDSAEGKITYSFIPKHNMVSITNTTYNKYGQVSADSGMEYNDVHFWFSGPQLVCEDGTSPDIGIQNWKTEYCNYEVISSKDVSFGNELTQGHIWTGNQGGAILETAAEAGNDYVFTALVDSSGSTAGVSVNGVRILSDKNAINGAEYYPEIHFLRYSFTATDDKISISFITYDENGVVSNDSGLDYGDVHLWFANLKLTAEDKTTAVYKTDDLTFYDTNHAKEIFDGKRFPSFGTVKGKVIRYGSTEDLLSVQLIPCEEEHPVYETSLSEKAQYSIECVPYGRYVLRLSKDGHISREYNVIVDRDEVVQDALITQTGDINVDGVCDIRDLVCIKKDLAYLSADDYRCDLNGTGTIDAIDLQEVRSLLLQGGNSPKSSLSESLILLFQEDKAEEYLPCVAYERQGKICDMMFDSFIMAWIWHYLPLPDKENITAYFDKMFESGINMDALDAAVGKAKKALGCDDYQAGVWIGFWIPEASIGTSFGKVAGKQLDLSLRSDRAFAMRWQMNEALRRFREKNYKNIKLVGFHCICESYDTSNKNFLETIKDFNSMVKAEGYRTNMGPYYHAPGWLENERMGFDWNTISPNYFKCGSPNAGDITRLESVGNSVEQFNIGMAMELETYNKTAVGVLKEYMQGGLDYGYYFTYHTWYMVNGASGIGYIFNNEDSEIRSAYDEIYRWIHRTLKSGEIVKINS